MFKTYYSPGIIESHFNIDDVFERYGLYENIKAYFIRNKIDCEFKNEDEEYISLIKKIQPKYVDIRDVQFWNTIISESPEFSKKQEKIRFFKNLMIEKFSYEQKPPRWLQAPEWPLDNNIPLKFIKQQSIESGMKYYFYNTKTKETKIIEQFN